MFWSDFIHLALRALSAHRLRSFLTLLGISVGIAAVILLTSLGEGLHRFVLNEFTQFGTHIIRIVPGREDPRGGPPGLPSTARELTLEDMRALQRTPFITNVIPAVSGNSDIQANGRVRRTAVYGTGPEMDQAFSIYTERGHFLPPDNPTSARAFVVLGAKLKRELFDHENALGKQVTIGGERYRIIGIMEEKGQYLGIDLDDVAYLPVSRALGLYNRSGLMEINVTYDKNVSSIRVVEEIRKTLIRRHGREDFTITTQEEMLGSLSNILAILTAAIAALGSISLLVGGIGIITIMTIAVSERTNEIGLLVAIGAKRHTILALFLGEATILAALGGFFGLVIGIGISQLLALFLPSLPISTPIPYAIAAEITAALIGLAAGVLPARKAAQLDPVEALRTE